MVLDIAERRNCANRELSAACSLFFTALFFYCFELSTKGNWRKAIFIFLCLEYLCWERAHVDTMRMETNKKAFLVLLALVFTSLVIFCAEKKFLVAEKRGSGLSKYDRIPWADKILLLVEDFEGLNPDSALAKERLFSYGSAVIGLDNNRVDEHLMAGKTVIRVDWNQAEGYGGWGKGVGENFDVNTETDHLNFRILIPSENGGPDLVKVILEEDDNDNGELEKDKDDEWFTTVSLPASNKWQLVSIPLKDLLDANPGGDGILNITRKGGLHTVIFSFMQPERYTAKHSWYFDFVFFSSSRVEDKKISNSLN